MSAPAKTPPGTARHVSLLGVHRNYFDRCPVQPQIEFPASGIAQACLDDDGRFQECGG
jgi:hypothetical protein